MYRKITLNVLGAATIALFVAAIIGMAVQGSHRWVQPLEQAAWIAFILTVISLFLFAVPGKSKLRVVSEMWKRRALVAAVIATAIFIASLIAYAVSAKPYAWIEALELAGILMMVATVISCVMATGGFGRSRD